MSYEIQVRHINSSGEGISAEAIINGESIAHTVPKGQGFMEKNEETGRPRIVDKLLEIYKERNEKTQDPVEEQKISENSLENKYFYENTWSREERRLNNDKKNNNGSGNVKLDDPEDIRSYLKENMAEGHLSKEEERNIDSFVDTYSNMMREDNGDTNKNFDQIAELIRNAFEGKIL